MNIELLIVKLINYYKIKTLNELAIKLDTTQSTISGWKARNAIGALTDTVANKDPEALEYIFANNHKSQNIGTITNSNVAQDFHAQSNGINQNCVDNDEATYQLYKETYQKAKEDGKIKEFRIHLMSF